LACELNVTLNSINGIGFLAKFLSKSYNILRHNTLYNNMMEVIKWTELIFYHAKKIVLAHVKDAPKQIVPQNIS